MKPLVWVGDIDSEFASRLTKYALKGGRALYLNSRGGETDHMCSALDLMATGEWITVGTGSIMSAAVPLLSSGAKGCRGVTPTTRLMIHLPRAWSFGASTSDELETESEELRHLEEIYCGALGRTTRKPKKFWLDKIRQKKDWYFNAEEAVALGLVDFIAVPDAVK